MTRLFDDPARFTEDMVTGFVAANSRYVRAVPGGVVRADRGREGKVAVITGGGSGHYPAFCGVVGAGFADGAVIGNIFTSPSAEQAYSVAMEADCGGGVFFTFGNYAGDNLNFGLAVQRLEAAGVRAGTLVVTDDVASAGVHEIDKRRGIAGDFMVFKVASAAAEAGYGFDDVRRVAEHCNDRTRTLGVAFDGCTLPGQDHPLFTVPDGKMGLGLGIHGEPGVSETQLPSASELAKTLFDGVLAEAPAGSKRVAAVLNGLGRTKYEELFVLWGKLMPLFAEAGFELVEPDVGELVTSLDMAGCSLTLTWLDDELEGFWTAACDTPAYRKGVASISAQQPARARHERVAEAQETVVASAKGQRAAALVVDVLDTIAATMADAEDELGRLDAVAGDGDHGRGMTKGSAAAAAAAKERAAERAGPASVLAAAGDAWAADAGGTSGVLWGAMLRAFGTELSDAGSCTAEQLAAGAATAEKTLTTLGKAELGDKTMLDAIAPFVHALSTGSTWRSAAAQAQRAAQDTASLRPRLGRARPLAERSVGTPDPGAVSFAMAVDAVGEVVEKGENVD
jgi:dihydroxyacetone kinase